MTKLDMPMKYHRPRSKEFSDKARRQLAQSAYERQNKPVEVKLSTPPWEKKSDDNQDPAGS